VLIEAKGAGFAPKAVKRAVKILRMDSEERAAMRSLEATVDLYLGLVEGASDYEGAASGRSASAGSAGGRGDE